MPKTGSKPHGDLPHWQFQSTLPGMDWPAMPDGQGKDALALLHQLDHSQWLPAGRLLQNQWRQLEILLQHAHATVPYYRERWGSVPESARRFTPEAFARLPVLGRRDLQGHFDDLRSRNVPPSHGGIGEAITTGSTGTPVRVLKTDLCQLLWRAFTLRDHVWQRRELSGKLAAIRHGVTEGEFDNWGVATHGLVATGPSVVLGIRHDVDAQLTWLRQQRPDYLITHPSILAELATKSLQSSTRLEHLREVRSFGEVLAPEVRELCMQAWGVPVTDAYSTNELGYIALQCPEHEHYHVQSENVLVEILRDDGAPCAAGEIGRVVVTTLHNFAMPLIRYELRDYAEAGGPCPCGRGLPHSQPAEPTWTLVAEARAGAPRTIALRTATGTRRRVKRDI